MWSYRNLKSEKEKR